MSEPNETQVQEATAVDNVPTQDIQTSEEAQVLARAAQVVAEKPYDGQFKVLKSLVMDQKTVTLKDEKGNSIGDITLSFPGTKKAFEITDNADVSRSAYTDALLKGVVVAPAELRAKGLDFFDTHAGLYEAITAADTFLVERNSRVSD